MANYKTMGSLANKLLNYISTTLVHDSNYDIAIILVKNYNKLHGMTISEVADLCYTSPASVSRFCRFFGFENFKEFRGYLEQDFTMRTDYSKQFYAILCKDEKMAISAYRDELIENIYATITEENIAVMRDVVSAMHESRNAAYFSHHFLWDIGRFFQSKMMIMGKYVEQFIDYDAQLKCAQSLQKEDFAIICTVAGSYTMRYKKIWNAIEESGCRLLVITQNISSPYLNRADFVLRCGISNKDDIGKYSAMMVIDYLVMSYLKTFGEY